MKRCARPRRSLVMILLASVALPAVAAKRLMPPTAALLAPENRVAVVTALERAEDGRIVFSLVEALQGESDARLVVRVGGELFERIEPGESYLLGYTTLRRDPRGRSRELLPDPEGARIAAVPVVGPALFEDTSEMRRLATPPAAAREADPAATLDAIVGQAARPDRLSRRFVLAELALRPALMAAIEPPHVEALQALLESGELEPMELDYLLRALAPMAETEHASWLAAGCRGIVGGHGQKLDLASYVPTLLATATAILGTAGNPGDVELLEPHLQSNNPGVGRAAIEAMGRLDPSSAAAAGRRALALDTLHVDVRTSIERFLAEQGS